MDLTNEEHRLLTFIEWPNKNLDPEELAQAGFHYLGLEDSVKCFCYDDESLEVHLKWPLFCEFAVEYSARLQQATPTNITTTEEPINESPTHPSTAFINPTITKALQLPIDRSNFKTVKLQSL